ncbi:MAG: hypothetical protein SFT91_04515 [Rickettsiaceae bacterium]|nr:hypothetical protein [Rickettsiaceae bacterium]
MAPTDDDLNKRAEWRKKEIERLEEESKKLADIDEQKRLYEKKRREIEALFKEDGKAREEELMGKSGLSLDSEFDHAFLLIKLDNNELDLSLNGIDKKYQENVQKRLDELNKEEEDLNKATTDDEKDQLIQQFAEKDQKFAEQEELFDTEQKPLIKKKEENDKTLDELSNLEEKEILDQDGNRIEDPGPVPSWDPEFAGQNGFRTIDIDKNSDFVPLRNFQLSSFNPINNNFGLWSAEAKALKDRAIPLTSEEKGERNGKEVKIKTFNNNSLVKTITGQEESITKIITHPKRQSAQFGTVRHVSIEIDKPGPKGVTVTLACTSDGTLPFRKKRNKYAVSIAFGKEGKAVRSKPDLSLAQFDGDIAYIPQEKGGNIVLPLSKDDVLKYREEILEAQKQALEIYEQAQEAHKQDPAKNPEPKKPSNGVISYQLDKVNEEAHQNSLKDWEEKKEKYEEVVRQEKSEKLSEKMEEWTNQAKQTNQINDDNAAKAAVESTKLLNQHKLINELKKEVHKLYSANPDDRKKGQINIDLKKQEYLKCGGSLKDFQKREDKFKAKEHGKMLFKTATLSVTKGSKDPDYLKNLEILNENKALLSNTLAEEAVKEAGALSCEKELYCRVDGFESNHSNKVMADISRISSETMWDLLKDSKKGEILDPYSLAGEGAANYANFALNRAQSREVELENEFEMENKARVEMQSAALATKYGEKNRPPRIRPKAQQKEIEAKKHAALAPQNIGPAPSPTGKGGATSGVGMGGP